MRFESQRAEILYLVPTELFWSVWRASASSQRPEPPEMYPAPSLLHIILSCALATLPLSTFVAFFSGTKIGQKWPNQPHFFLGGGASHYENKMGTCNWSKTSRLFPSPSSSLVWGAEWPVTRPLWWYCGYAVPRYEPWYKGRGLDTVSGQNNTVFNSWIYLISRF